MMIKLFLGICVAYAVMSIFTVKSAVMLVQGLCIGTGIAKSNATVTGSERMLAEEYVGRCRIIPKKFRGRAARSLLSTAYKVTGW